ncbi:MAG: autotransporter outer membrane beta-barrel domain-containing protein [Planctomycetota bacterium]|nr:autotransporter outer membrane beta-barrel domain-containing protein [Planctomycetota bacterium]
MRLKRVNSWPMLMAGFLAAPLATVETFGQTNEFDASSTTPVTLNFTAGGQWDQGGPTTWPNQTEVDGSILFRMAPVTGQGSDVTVDNINSTYTGITSLLTSEGTANSILTLQGSGGFVMNNTLSNVVDITPTVDLILAIDIQVDCDLVIDTTNLANPATQGVSFNRSLVLTQQDATVTITGAGAVTFETGSSLDLVGTLLVGADASDGARLVLNEGTSFNGAIDLSVSQLARVIVDTNTLTLNSLQGSGTIQETDGLSEVDLIINGGTQSEFTGTLLLDNNDSSLTVTNGSTLILGAGSTAGTTLTTNAIGQTRVTDGGKVLITPMRFGGTTFDNIATLNTTLFIDGGTFGGEGIVELDFNAPDPNFEMISGWIQGGNDQGTGTLTFQGIAFGGTSPINFDDDAGLWVYFDPTNPNVDAQGDRTPYIEFADVTAGVLFSAGANIHVELIGQPDYFDRNASAEQWFANGWQSLEGELLLLSTPFNGSLIDLTGGDWDGSTNLATRVLTVFTNSDNPDFTELYGQITADYSANAGEFQVLGDLLNDLLPAARLDPFGDDARLLTFLDRETYLTGGTNSAYFKALQQNLTPQSALVSDRVTANNMYFDVSRRNLREVAIGTRGPGMLKSGSIQASTLMASQEEASAVSANSNASAPPVIIQGTPSPTKPTSDVFQALFVEGYGRWDRMDQEGSVVGYNATTTGVATGWGIGLSDGITIGLTAGWENVSADLVENLGNTKVNSFRGTPFISWSGISGKAEQYAMLAIGGGYNTADGVQKSGLTLAGITKQESFNIDGWEFDVEGAVGARIPLSETVAVQPEASLRYSLLNYSGTITPNGQASTDYSGGDTSFINGRVGAAMEWLISPTLRVSGSLGYQGQAIDFGTAQFSLPAGLGTADLDFGSGQINQIYTGAQLLWAPSWNTSLSISYDGAYGDGDQNAISGGVLIRF